MIYFNYRKLFYLLILNYNMFLGVTTGVLWEDVDQQYLFLELWVWCTFCLCGFMQQAQHLH